MNSKLAISGIIIIALFALLGWLATKVKKQPSDVAINLVLLIFGCSVGWIVGIFLTPYDTKQATDFAEYASVIALFASGYLLGKVDAAISHLFRPEYLFTPIIGFRMVTTISSFLLAVLATVVIRYYA